MRCVCLEDDFIDVGYIKLMVMSRKFCKIRRNKCMEFSQGVGYNGSIMMVIYNCTSNDIMISKIVNIHSGDENIIPFQLILSAPMVNMLHPLVMKDSRNICLVMDIAIKMNIHTLMKSRQTKQAFYS